MGLFGGIKRMITGPKPPKIEKPDAPDFGTYWKQYSGWLANINDRNAGELANVRARLAAAGASPDALMMATEQLESQRLSDIALLEGGETKRFLDEGFDIFLGKAKNPYKQPMPGAQPSGKYVLGEGEVDPAAPTTLAEYYTKYYGEGSAAEAPTLGEAASKRARKAAGGVAPSAEAGSGSASAAGMNPVFGTKDESFWR